MKHKLIRLGILFLFGCFACLVNAQNIGTHIFQRVSPSVGSVKVYDAENKLQAQASAFVIDRRGVLVTNAHVLDGGVRFTVTLPDMAALPVMRILHIDLQHDLAYLKVPKRSFTPLILSDSDSISVGETIFTIGSPHGLENTISSGILSGVRKFGAFGEMLQISAPISEGSSGGVLVNDQGQAIGITTFVVKSGQNLNFAIPINIVKKYLPEIEPRLSESHRPPPVDSTQLMKLKLPSAMNTSRSSLNLLMSIAYSAFEAKDYEVAKESFLHILQIDSTQIDALKGLAHSCFRADDKKEAMSWYRKALARDSSDVEIFFYCGVTARHLGNDSLAIAMYQKALDIQPEFWEAWFEIGLVHGRKSEYQQAIYSFNRAHNLNKSDWSIPFYLGVTALALDDFENAANWLSEAAGKNSEKDEVWFKLGIAHYKMEEYQKATDALKKAVELNPQNGPGYLWLAFSVNASKDSVSAKKYVQRALPLLTDTSDKINGHLLLADLHLQAKAPDLAIAESQKARALDPDNLAVHEMLARAYLARGDYLKAKEEYAIIEKITKRAQK